MMPARIRKRPGKIAPKKSGKPPVRVRAPQRTREGLVAAAAALFRADGLDAPSLDAICERAGYTRGAFYVHFASRDELVGVVVEQTLTQLLESVVGEDETDLHAVVDRFLATLHDGRLEVAGHVRISQVLEACARSWPLRVKLLAILVSARARIGAAMRAGQAAGTLRRDLSPESVSELFLAIVLGVLTATQLEAPYDAAGARADLLTMLSPDPPRAAPPGPDPERSSS